MKRANHTLLLLGIPAAIVLVLGIVALVSGSLLLDTAGSMWNEATETTGPVGDVEGYAMLIGMAGAGFSGLAGLAVQLVGAILALYGGGVLLFSAIARAVLGRGAQRLLPYRVLMGIAYFIALIPVPELLKIFGRALGEGAFQPVPLASAVLVCVLVILGARNTYTDRIYS